MVLYISCSSHSEDLEHLEALRRKGASVLWIWPYTSRQEAFSGSAADTGCYQGQIRRWRVEE